MATSIANSKPGAPYNVCADSQSRAAARAVRRSSGTLPAPVGHTVLAVCSKCMRHTHVDVSVFELNTRALCPPCARELGQSGRD